jgi:hypothetical protein
MCFERLTTIFDQLPSDVRYGSLADIGVQLTDVRFTPESGHAERQHRRALSANSGHQPARDLRTFSKAEGARPHTSALLYRSHRAT